MGHKVMAQGIHVCSHVGAPLRGERPINSALPHSNSAASLQQGRPPKFFLKLRLLRLRPGALLDFSTSLSLSFMSILMSVSLEHSL